MTEKIKIELTEENFCRIYFDGMFEKALTEDGVVLDKASCDKVAKKSFRALVEVVVVPAMAAVSVLKENGMLDDWKYNHLVSSLEEIRETATDIRVATKAISDLLTEYAS